MTIRPINKLVLAKAYVEPKKPGQLILSAKEEHSNIYDVLSIGHKVEFISEGDRIIIQRNHGKDVEVDGETLTLIMEDSILGIIEED